MKRLLDFLIRREACRLAARSAQGQCGEGAVAERLWSLCVFFEMYMREGSEGTLTDFGYKGPVNLQQVRSDNAR